MGMILSYYIGVTPFATIAVGVALSAVITVRACVLVKGVVGCGTITKESNTERYIKGATAASYIRRLSVSTYKKEDATVRTLFSNTEQRVHY